MIPCRLVRILPVVIPFRRVRDILISRHTERCPRCEAKVLSKHDARPWLFADKDIQADPGFWPAVKDKIRAEACREMPETIARAAVPRSLRWAAIAALFICIAAGLWIVRRPGTQGISPEADDLIRFRLNYLKIDGAPVEPVVIQPRDSDLVIVWAATMPRFP